MALKISFGKDREPIEVGKTFRRYRGLIFLLLGLLGLQIFHDLQILKELSSALVVAGFVTLFVDESTRLELKEIFINSHREAKERSIRSFIGAMYQREIPDHVWRHCEALFEHDFTREDYDITYELSPLPSDGLPAFMQVKMKYNFYTRNITERAQDYVSKFRLEANGRNLSADSLRRLKISSDSVIVKEYTPEEIKSICTFEYEDDENSALTYYLWKGFPLEILPGKALRVEYEVCYQRGLNDFDNFLSGQSANRIRVDIHFPQDYEVMTFQVTPNRPAIDRKPGFYSVTIRDVTPYQGVVFSWRQLADESP